MTDHNVSLFQTASEVSAFILDCVKDMDLALSEHSTLGERMAESKRKLIELEARVKARKAQIILETDGPEYKRKAQADLEIIGHPVWHDYLKAVKQQAADESAYFTSLEHVHNRQGVLEASRSISSAFKAEESLTKGPR